MNSHTFDIVVPTHPEVSIKTAVYNHAMWLSAHPGEIINHMVLSPEDVENAITKYHTDAVVLTDVMVTAPTDEVWSDSPQQHFNLATGDLFTAMQEASRTKDQVMTMADYMGEF